MKVTLYVRGVGRIRGDVKVKNGDKVVVLHDLMKNPRITVKQVYIAGEDVRLNSVSEMVVNTEHISLIY